MAISPWLQALSSFCGSVCKKYPLDLGGILQFVANQLKSERSIDILLLKDIVQKMGGTDSMGDLTPDQVSQVTFTVNLAIHCGLCMFIIKIKLFIFTT